MSSASVAASTRRVPAPLKRLSRAGLPWRQLRYQPPAARRAAA